MMMVTITGGPSSSWLGLGSCPGQGPVKHAGKVQASLLGAPSRSERFG